MVDDQVHELDLIRVQRSSGKESRERLLRRLAVPANQIFLALGLTPLSFTDDTIQESQTVVKIVHIAELRPAVILLEST